MGRWSSTGASRIPLACSCNWVLFPVRNHRRCVEWRRPARRKEGIMSTIAPNPAMIKAALTAAWPTGDFGQIAQYDTAAGEAFVQHLALTPGERVLDVACGTGNFSLPAARAGAQVTGLDIAPNLLAQARARAQ